MLRIIVINNCKNQSLCSSTISITRLHHEFSFRPAIICNHFGVDLWTCVDDSCYSDSTYRQHRDPIVKLFLPSILSMSQQKDELSVYGYIRENFDKRCWVAEIIETIIQFYMIKGGSLYVFGDDKTPTICTPFDKNNALQVAASVDHTLVVDVDCNVWCFGRGDYGQLGTGNTTSHSTPTQLKLKNKVISVCAGRNHSLLLCDNGWVQSFGLNESGQLGHGNLETSLIPKTIEKLTNVIQISAGNARSAALTEDGDLFCFGGNYGGQCGVGKEKGWKIMTPIKVALDDEIEFVDCGFWHTLLITRKGLIYSVGNGGSGQLGHGDGDHKSIPTLIEALKEIKIKTCAAASHHSLCVDEKGQVWSFGSDEYGECGLSCNMGMQCNSIQYTPKMIDWFIANKIKAKECAAGGNASFVISEDGALYAFGKNEEYQLGLKEKKNYYTPTKLSLSVQCVSVGSYQTAVIGQAL